MTDLLRWSTLDCVGADATSFLNGQLSQNMDQVSTGAWSGLLDPSGVVVTILWVRPTGSGWELLVPRERAELAERRLRRFLLRVDCTISVRDGADSPPLLSEDERFDRRLPWSHEFAADLLPHSFGTQFVAETVSLTKGCFTGQEMVGRMDARGASMPWRLVMAQGPSVEVLDAALHEVGPDGPKGVTSSRQRGACVEAFGVAHRSRLTTPVDTEGVVIEVVD